MTVDINNEKHLIADDGKVLKRTVGFPLVAKEIFLGTVIIDGIETQDKAENYIEIDKPVRKNRNNIEEEQNGTE